MQNALLTKYINKNKREKESPAFRPGDTIKVHVKIREGDKERLQAFEGTSAQMVSSKPEKNNQKLAKAVNEVFARYPPR